MSRVLILKTEFFDLIFYKKRVSVKNQKTEECKSILVNATASDFYDTCKKFQVSDQHVFSHACFFNYRDLAQLMISKKVPVPPGACTNVVEYGSLRFLKELVKHGADIHEQDDDALFVAASYGKLLMLKYLISLGMERQSIEHARDVSKTYRQAEVYDYLTEVLETCQT